MTCAQDGSILVHKVGATLEKCAEISREEKNKLNAKKQAELKVVQNNIKITNFDCEKISFVTGKVE